MLFRAPALRRRASQSAILRADDAKDVRINSGVCASWLVGVSAK